MQTSSNAAVAAPTHGSSVESAPPIDAAAAIASPPEPFAEIRVHITHNAVVLTAILGMGGQHVELRRWNRYRGHGKGWMQQGGGDFIKAEDRISRELAEYADGLNFPFAVANMLPGKRSAADVAAAADAAREVANA